MTRILRLSPWMLFVSLLFVALTATANAAPTAEVALDRYRTALASYRVPLDRQGVLFETFDGESLLAYNVDCPFNPASVVKLATSDVALARLGPNYRFPTAFYTNGGFDAESGTLVGDLIVLGAGDPSLTTEHAFYVARELRARGIRHITGNVIVKGSLYCNYSMDRRAAGSALLNALDVERWNGSIESSFGRYRVQTGQDTFESVTIDGAVVADPSSAITGLTPLFTFRSMPLFKILKQQNDYSNNWIAHVVGSFVGGPAGIKSSLVERLHVPSDELYFATTSGLGSNGMRPTDVVGLLREMQSRLRSDALTPAHLMPVAGVDPGTLEDRYLSPGFRGAVVAKTGTLRGVSALAGYMYTRNKGVVLFSIMNQGGSPATLRRLQDSLVAEMFEVCGGPAPIAYMRPLSYGDLAGGFIERAVGNIPEIPKAALEAAN